MHSRSAGFTLTEALVIVALIGILSTTALISTQRMRFERQRAALNTTVRDLAYWLDLIRARAATGTACTVTITTGSLAAGATLASVSPTSCGANLTLDAEAAAQAVPLAVALSPSSTIVYTTLGGAQPGSIQDIDGFDAVQVAISSTSANLRRCLAISNGTGSLRFGAANTSGGTCSYTAPL